MSTWQALFIGLLQGASELFPVSSLGHAVIIPALLHWRYNQADPSFVPFLTLLHLGTAGALLFLYRQEWVRIVAGFVRAAVSGRIENEDQRLAMLLTIGTVPTAVVGVLLEARFKQLFASPRFAAAALIVNGAILLGAELIRRRDERRAHLEDRDREGQEEAYADLSRLDWKAALAVGLAQSLALLPGISRSGVTIAAGLFAGLRHQEAARFTFLLATPIIAGAGILEVPQLFGTKAPLGTYLLAAVLAGLAAYASARFLIRYFRSGRLDPYAYYCIALGALSLALLR